MSISENNKIIVILGPTACGKTKLAVELAAEFDGEIVSADSRQVYRGMDVGTGKDLREYVVKLKTQNSKLKTIPYHLIDVVEPGEDFNLAMYQEQACEAIDDILKRKKLPILVGGSGLYLQAVVDGYELSDSQPNRRQREELESMPIEILWEKLVGKNKVFAEKLNESDRQNKRRLIRYLEIANSTQAPNVRKAKPESKYEFLMLGVTFPIDEIRKRIKKRLLERLEKEDMVGEVERLHEQGLDWKRLESFGLEYKFISYYLQEKIDYETMVDKLNIAIGQFAKRQMTWFKRWERQGKKIHWISDLNDAESAINIFLKKK